MALRKLHPTDVRPGDELYIPTALSIDHGWDDRCGGIAVVEKVDYHPVPKNPINEYFVYFAGIWNGLNLPLLLRDQTKLAKEYGNRLAHQCPEDKPCPAPKQRGGIKRTVKRRGKPMPCAQS